MALYYTEKNEVIEISEELYKTYEMLAERNPNDTNVEHTVEVMEYLNEFIRESSEYNEYFAEEEEEFTKN